MSWIENPQNPANPRQVLPHVIGFIGVLGVSGILLAGSPVLQSISIGLRGALPCRPENPLSADSITLCLEGVADALQCSKSHSPAPNVEKQMSLPRQLEDVAGGYGPLAESFPPGCIE